MNANLTDDISNNVPTAKKTIDDNQVDTSENRNQVLSTLQAQYSSASLILSIQPPSAVNLYGLTGQTSYVLPESQVSHYLELQTKYPMLSTSAIAMMALAQVMQDSLDGLMNEIDIQNDKMDTMRVQNISTNKQIQKQIEKMSTESGNSVGKNASGENQSTTDKAEAAWKTVGIIAQLVVLILCIFGAFFTGGLTLMLFSIADAIASSIIKAIASNINSLSTQKECSIALSFFSLNIFSEGNDIALERGDIDQKTHDKRATGFMWGDILLNLAMLAITIWATCAGVKKMASVTKDVSSALENAGNLLLAISGLLTSGLTIANGVFSIQKGNLDKDIAATQFNLSSLRASVTWIQESLKDDNDYLSYLIKMFSQRATDVGNAWKQTSDVMQVELESKTQTARNI